MAICIDEIDIGELSNNNPFVSSNWAIIKSKNNWSHKAFIININDKRYEMLILIRDIKKGFSFAYAPFSPYPLDSSPLSLAVDNLEYISKDIKKKLPSSVFIIRYDIPFSYKDVDKVTTISKAFKINKNSVQPNETIFIDLDRGIDLIRKDYRSRAKRHLKKNSQKVSISVWNDDIHEKEIWYNIYRETGLRDGFAIRSLDYINQILECPNSTLILAKIDDKIVGGNIILFGFGLSVYLIGGSIKDCGYSVAYSIQDYSIKLSCEKKCKYYDLFGVGGKNSEHLKTLNLFKSSFGGTKINRISSFDYVIKPFIYSIYRVVEKLRYLFYRG